MVCVRGGEGEGRIGNALINPFLCALQVGCRENGASLRGLSPGQTLHGFRDTETPPPPFTGGPAGYICDYRLSCLYLLGRSCEEGVMGGVTEQESPD